MQTHHRRQHALVQLRAGAVMNIQLDTGLRIWNVDDLDGEVDATRGQVILGERFAIRLEHLEARRLADLGVADEQHLTP